MQNIELAHEAQCHREAYIAVLNGLLADPASKRHFAQQVGITPQYLSYLLNPYDRTPSPEVARKIAEAAPLACDARESLYEHLLLAHERRLQAQLAVNQKVPKFDVQAHFALIQQAQSAANFAADPQQMRAQQQIVRTVGKQLLAQLDQTQEPLGTAQLCIWLHNAESALNLHANALYYATKARVVLSQWTSTEIAPSAREAFGVAELNALRAVATAYHNIKLLNVGYALCCQAEALTIVRQRPAEWLPHLCRDKLNALQEKTRFSLREAEALTQAGKRWCERSVHPHAGLWAFMLDRSLAQLYLHSGNGKKAARLLSVLAEQIEVLPVVGALHRVLFLKTYAEALWLMGDQAAWATTIQTALQLANAGGLTHQISEIRKWYGEALPWLAGD
ncbi:MAG: helix-turn-helix transcriptional regulator [Caldilineaceae bacterium]